MAYQTKYILGFQNALNEFYEIFFEFKDYIGIPSNLIAAVDSFTLRNDSADDNKLFPVLGTECLIKILVGKSTDQQVVTDDSTLSIFDLIAAHDDDIRISIYRDRDYSKTIYQGFVVVEDNTQPFQNPPYIVSVRALDGLGLLKQVDMVDTEGNLFAGNISIIDWYGNILMKTSQTMNVRFYFPFRPVGFDGTPMEQQTFLNAIAWQTGELTQTTDPSVDVFASAASDAYTALETLTRNLRCRIFQEDGCWNVVSLYAHVDPTGMSYTEYSASLVDGVYVMTPVSVGNNLNLDTPVGKEDIIHPVEGDAMIALKLATKWVKLNYTYDQSVNKVCNQKLSEGNPDHTEDGTMSSTIYDPTIDPVVTFNYFGFVAFCYTHLNGGGDFSTGFYALPSTAANAAGGIREIRDFIGNPIDRFLYLATPSGTSITYFKTSQLLIDKGDILQVSFQWRTRDNLSDPSGNNYTVAWIHLYGDDGTFWSYDSIADGSLPGNPNHWVASDSNFQHGSVGDTLISTDLIYNTNTWSSVNINQNISIGVIDQIKTPVNGRLEILFVFNTDPHGGGEAWFKNIQVTILPYLQGSYIPLKGDYNFSTTDLDIKQTMSEAVEISDSPKRYFKGALVRSNGDLIPPEWHRKGVTEMMRFQQAMERLVYNNIYRQLQRIEGTFRGHRYVLPDLTVKDSGLLNTYHFTQHPVPTKKFILTSFERDYGKGSGRHVFMEILEDQNADPYVEVSDYLFQYIYE